MNFWRLIKNAGFKGTTGRNMTDAEYDESKGTLPDMNIFSQVLKDSFAPANIVQSLVNKYTDAGTTGRDVALNDMNRQNVVDQASLEVEGYKKAGLNSALMYGSGTNSAPQSSGAPSGGSLQELVSLMALPAQIENMRANTRKQIQETSTNMTMQDKMVQETANLKQQFENMLSDKNLTDAKRAEIEKGLAWADRLNSAALAKTESETHLNESAKKEIDELLDNKKLHLSKSIEDFEHRWSEIDAAIKKMSAETGLIYEDIANYTLNHMSNGFMGTGLSLQNLFRTLFGISQGSERATGRPSSDPGHGYSVYTNQDFQRSAYGRKPYGRLYNRH